MQTEQNKATFLRYADEVFRAGNIDAVDAYIAPDFISHNLPPGQAQGPEGIKNALRGLHSAFPDLEATLDDLLAEGDKVAARYTVRGIHAGTFLGIAGTGKRVTVAAIGIYRFAEGQFVESWVQMDTLGLLQQLGVVPMPGQAPA